jgi:hypothetical protein
LPAVALFGRDGSRTIVVAQLSLHRRASE